MATFKLYTYLCVPLFTGRVWNNSDKNLSSSTCFGHSPICHAASRKVRFSITRVEISKETEGYQASRKQSSFFRKSSEQFPKIPEELRIHTVQSDQHDPSELCASINKLLLGFFITGRSSWCRVPDFTFQFKRWFVLQLLALVFLWQSRSFLKHLRWECNRCPMASLYELRIVHM